MVEETVKKILMQLFSLKVHDINENTSSDTVPSWTSLQHINLVMALEEAFNIQFSPQQMLEMLNFPLIVMTVKEAIQNGS